MTGPPFSTTSRARPPSVPVVMAIQPPGALWQTALSTTFSTIRRSRARLPATQAPPWRLVSWTVRPMARMAAA